MDECLRKGFRDPTAERAIANVAREDKRKYKKRVFICSPFAGAESENTLTAIRYCRFAISQSYAPFAPHLLYPRLLLESNPRQREIGIRCGLAFLATCKELWVFGTNITPGMKREILQAREYGKIIRYFNEKCEEVFKNAKCSEYTA